MSGLIPIKMNSPNTYPTPNQTKNISSVCNPDQTGGDPMARAFMKCYVNPGDDRAHGVAQS